MKKVLFFITIVKGFLFFSNAAFGQTVGGNMYLQGHYVEIGVTPNASFGAPAPPAGYHPHCASCTIVNGLGEVYDWDHNGWTIGAPAFMGDYTFPGAPQEGWAIQVNGNYNNAFQAGGYAGTGTLTGILTSYTNSGGVITATWTGTDAGLAITQKTIVDTEASWVLVTVLFTNPTSSAIPGVYYERTCDPDDDETWPGGSFVTNNSVTYQNDVNHRVEVSATGTAYPVAEDYLGICTKDCRAKAFVLCNSCGIFPINQLDQIYAGSGGASGYLYTTGSTQTADIGIGVVWDIGTIATGGSDSISYAYIFNSTTGIDSVFANLPPCVSTPIMGLTSICTGQVTTLSDATAGGAWSSSNVAVATVDATGDVTGVSAGAVTISYTTGGICCYTTTTMTIGSPTPITGITTICTGATTTLSNATSGGTWSSNNTFIATVSATGVVSGVSAGSAMISYYFTGGCFTTATVTVSTTSPAAITGPANVCTGSTITLNDLTSGGTWSAGSPGIATVVAGTGVVHGVTAGITTITYTTACGSTMTTITVDATPSISGALSVCVGGTTALTCSPPGGTWSSGAPAKATVSATGVVTGVALGTATITYISGSCYTTANITVTPGPTAITGNTAICTGETSHLSDGVSGGVWNSGATTVATVSSSGIVSGVSAGSSVIFYTIGSGCVSSTTVTVITGTGAISGAANICAGTTTTLSDSPPGGVWSSSNPAVATISAGGTVYGVTGGPSIITYTLGSCFSIAGITINAFTPPITGPTNLCTGQPTVLSDAAAPGGVWSSNNTAIATIDAGTGIITGVSAGSATITYSLGVGCVATTSVTVFLSPDAGTVTGGSSVCVSNTITLNNPAAGGAGVWNSSNGTAIVSGGTVTGVSPGIDTIQYIVSTGVCADTAIKAVTVYPLADAGAITGPLVVCQGMAIALSDTVLGGMWSAVSPGIATVSPGGIVTGLSAGTDTIKYTVSNPACMATVSWVVTVYYSPPAGMISGKDAICAPAIFTLHDTSPGGVWGSSNQTVASIDSSTGTVHATGPGTAIITYTTGSTVSGCTSMATFTVTAFSQAPFTVNSSVSQISCYGADNGSITITISGYPSLQYLWSTPPGTNATSISGLAPGEYTLHITDTLIQCIAADSFRINEPDSIVIKPTTNNDLCYEGTGSVILAVTGGTGRYTYLWSNGKTDSAITALTGGTYSVTVTDSNGCTKNISAVVNEDTCSEIIIHDVLTPNGDGINDTWVIEGIENYPTNSVEVFDKWGDMIYHASNYKNDWNGKGKKGELPDGTYFYLVKLNAKNRRGNQDMWTGSLLLKR